MSVLFLISIVIKCGTIAPLSSDWFSALKNLSLDIEKETAGKVKIEIYTGGILGDEPQIAEKFLRGNIDCFAGTGSGASKIFPYIVVFELPFLILSEKEYDYVKDDIEKLLEKFSQERGLKFFGTTEVGIDYFFSKRPIKNISDFVGLIHWNWKDNYFAEIYKKAIKKLGGKVVDIPIIDITKRFLEVDVIRFPPYALLTFSAHDIARYAIKQPFRFIVAIIVIQEKTWNSIDDELKPIIEKKVKETLRYMSSRTRENNMKALKLFEERGMKFIELSQDDYQKLKIAFEESYKDLENIVPSWLSREIMMRILKIRAQYGIR